MWKNNLYLEETQLGLLHAKKEKALLFLWSEPLKKKKKVLRLYPISPSTVVTLQSAKGGYARPSRPSAGRPHTGLSRSQSSHTRAGTWVAECPWSQSPKWDFPGWPVILWRKIMDRSLEGLFRTHFQTSSDLWIFLGEWKCSISARSSEVTLSNMWLLSTWHVVSVAEALNFTCYWNSLKFKRKEPHEARPGPEQTSFHRHHSPGVYTGTTGPRAPGCNTKNNGLWRLTDQGQYKLHNLENLLPWASVSSSL